MRKRFIVAFLFLSTQKYADTIDKEGKKVRLHINTKKDKNRGKETID